MIRDARAGFTLMEVLGVLVITAVIAAGVWSVVESVTRGQLQAMDDADRAAGAAAIERVLRDALRQATLGTLAAPNAGPVQVAVAGDGAADDTLLVLRAEGPPMTGSTRPCPGGGACVYLVGDHAAALKRGAVLLVGAPAMGARIVQVAGDARATRAACGADCAEEVACPTVADEPAQDAEEVTGSVLYAPDGGASPRAGPCEQSYLPDGSWCAEVRTAAPATRRHWRCQVRGAVAVYTEVPVAERAAGSLRFPAGAVAPLRSGAALVPRVSAQRVTPSRFFVRRASARSTPLLVRQTGVDAAGAWHPAVPVGGPVSAFEVATLHAGEADWTRGVGVDEAALVRSAANPNYQHAPTASGEPGFAFRRGYHDLDAVRVRFTLVTPRGDGTVAQVPHEVVVAAGRAPRGGGGG